MKNLLAQLKTEDWVIVLAGVAILALALLFPAGMPAMPKTLTGGGAWLEAGCMFAFLFVLTCLCMAVLGRPVKGIFGSLLAIFAVALAAQAVASVPLFKDLGLESVFFSVIFGLAVSNFFRVPAWLKPAIQSEFYIKIGIVCLGATILFGEILHSGVYALAQAFIVVFLVWYFAFWVSRRMKVDDEMATMLSSSVSICGVSAAIATCGVIKGDNKKLSYIINPYTTSSNTIGAYAPIGAGIPGHKLTNSVGVMKAYSMIFEIEKPLFGTMIIEQGLFIVQLKQKKGV